MNEVLHAEQDLAMNTQMLTAIIVIITEKERTRENLILPQT